jgi:hypothetical protein
MNGVNPEIERSRSPSLSISTQFTPESYVFVNVGIIVFISNCAQIRNGNTKTKSEMIIADLICLSAISGMTSWF